MTAVKITGVCRLSGGATSAGDDEVEMEPYF